jgi:lysophospholipase L1-like esterase
MKTVLCFGDSNTWGYVPGSDAERFPRGSRWPVRLAAALGEEWDVIAEGLNGRTASLDSPTADGRNGLTYIVPCLQSHMPVDVLVIYLGTNDVSDRFRLPDADAALAVARLVRAARACEAGPEGAAPDVLVVAPPPFEGHTLGPHYAEMCRKLDCAFLDLDGVTRYSDFDPFHLDADGQVAVATAVEERIRQMAA